MTSTGKHLPLFGAVDIILLWRHIFAWHLVAGVLSNAVLFLVLSRGISCSLVNDISSGSDSVINGWNPLRPGVKMDSKADLPEGQKVGTNGVTGSVGNRELRFTRDIRLFITAASVYIAAVQHADVSNDRAIVTNNYAALRRKGMRRLADENPAAPYGAGGRAGDDGFEGSESDSESVVELGVEERRLMQSRSDSGYFSVSEMLPHMPRNENNAEALQIEDHHEDGGAPSALLRMMFENDFLRRESELRCFAIKLMAFMAVVTIVIAIVIVTVTCARKRN